MAHKACVSLLVAIIAMWLHVFHYVLVHNSECVEQTVLVQTHTKDNADKNSRSGGGQGQGFRMMQLVVYTAFTFCLQA